MSLSSLLLPSQRTDISVAGITWLSVMRGEARALTLFVENGSGETGFHNLNLHPILPTHFLSLRQAKVTSRWRTVDNNEKVTTTRIRRDQ